MLNKHPTVLVAAMCMGLCSACGSAVGAATSEGSTTATDQVSTPTMTSTTPVDPGPPMRFPETSFDGMTQVAANDCADSSKLPFTVAYPDGAGVPPLAVWLSDPAVWRSHDNEVILEYDQSSSYGAFRAIERQPAARYFSASYITELVQNCQSCSDARVLGLGNGVQGALLYGAPGPTSVTWLQGPWVTIVIGSNASFGEDTAISIAKGLVANLAAVSQTAP